MTYLREFGGVIWSAITAHFSRYFVEWILLIIAVTTLGWSGYTFFLAPPADFPVGKMVAVKRGEAAPQIAEDLQAAHVIRNPFVFRVFLRLTGQDQGLVSGTYRFETPVNVLTVASRVADGDFGISAIRITFIEGITARGMAALVSTELPDISKSEFLGAAQPYEGYLFPDTYKFAPDVTSDEIVQILRDNFNTRTADLAAKIAASGHSLSDIVILASIIEREAKGETDKRMISGILWNRLNKGIPLQVDAVFGYIYDRATYSPSLKDLQTDSPYNTYLHKGLPPGPISNPGLESLEAAANPTKSQYFYYLTGRDGVMRYATTFEQHKVNRAKYLD